MKLSELVAYYNQLNRFRLDDARAKIDFDVSNIKHLINSKEFDPNNIKGQIQTKHAEIHQRLDEFVALIEQAKAEAQAEIDLKQQYWLEESYRLYSQEMIHDTTDHILNRRPALSEEHYAIIRGRVVGFSNSRQPGMIIRPGLEPFIKDMVAFDPLYLVDQNEELLFPSTFEFPEQYKRRLRPYIVSEHDSMPILGRLPDGQFGVCLAYNFFNFKPMPVIERYLEEIFVKLKPGGRLMMTFNDCDNEKAVRLAESYYACYTPGKMVKEIAQHIGYEIYFIWNDGSPSTWIELQKPGILTSLRGGQALAKIVHKT